MKMKVSDLKFDNQLLEIRKIDMVTVSIYRQHARSGVQFPPIIINKATNAIVSGNHRVKMYQLEFGPDYEVEVIAKKYKNRAEILKEFVKENISHGRPFSGNERRQSVIELMKHGMTSQECADLFNVPVQRIESWGGMCVVVVGNGGRQEVRTIKKGIEHLYGTEMSEEKYEVHKQADRGVSCYEQAKQLIRWVNNGWINRDSHADMDALHELRDVLIEFLHEDIAIAQ